jgi:streptogramin lyase
MAAMSSHTLKRPRTMGAALVVAAAMGAAALFTVLVSRGGGGGEVRVSDAGSAQVTASRAATVQNTQGAEARVMTFSDPVGRLDSPRGLTVGPDGNLWFTADQTQLGRMTPRGEVTLYRDPAGLVDTPDSIRHRK